jgi:hypothetical protein
MWTFHVPVYAGKKLSEGYYRDRLTTLLKQDSKEGLQTLFGFDYRMKFKRKKRLWLVI